MYVRKDYPTIPWILYIMVMFKRYGQLLLKMPSLSEESTLYHLPRELSSFVIFFFIYFFISPLYLLFFLSSSSRHCRVTLDPQN